MPVASNELHETAGDLSRLLSAAERDGDQAVVSIAKLLAATAQARMTTPVPPAAGQAAMMRLTRSIGKAVEMTGDILRAHGELGDIYRTHAGPDSHPYTHEEMMKKGEPVPAFAPVPAEVP